MFPTLSNERIGGEWKDLGRFTAGVIVDGRIYAVLYWSEGFAAEEPGGEALRAAPPGWYLAFADDPDAQLKLDSSRLEPVEPDMSGEEIHFAMRSAVLVARVLVRRRLGIND
jgi:hypothetical protein